MIFGCCAGREQPLHLAVTNNSGSSAHAKDRYVLVVRFAKPKRRRTSTSPSSRTRKSRMSAGTARRGPGPKGSAMTVSFELEGQQFMALNGGPHFRLTPAISLFVNCETQDEVDELWDKLLAGGGQEEPLRLAAGPLRPVVADHPDDAGKAAGRSRSAEVKASDAGDAADGQDRYRAPAAGVRARMKDSVA